MSTARTLCEVALHVEDSRLLMLAVKHGRREVVAELLGRGADIHARGDVAIPLAAQVCSTVVALICYLVQACGGGGSM